MNNQTNQNNETKEISLRSRIYGFLKKNHVKIICFMVFALVIYTHYMGYSVLAGSSGGDTTGGAGTQDALWKTIITLIKTWITRLGGAVMLVGGVMFGLGWKSDDAEQKSRGVSTMIGGAIVIAVAQVAGTFLK